VLLSGLRVNRYKLFAFVVAGAAAGLAGAMLAARLGQGAVNAGSGMLFLTLAGCVIGGTLLSGGRGGVLHSALGVLTLTVLADGMVLLGAGPYVQQAVEGAVVVAVVAATNWRSRARLRIVP